MSGYMYCRGTGFILFLLLSPAFGEEIHNLKNIIDHLQKYYGINGQYALGINVLAKYCAQDASLEQDFLSQDPENKVKSSMRSPECIYVGKELVGARPKRKNSKINIHAESLLLRINDPPPMQDLLNKLKAGCTVFYTKNSPCVQSCSTPTGNYSIIPALDMFTRHKGPKAFVFSQIFKYDVVKKEWEQNIFEIENRIPVYRCDNTGCDRCITNNELNSRCKAS